MPIAIILLFISFLTPIDFYLTFSIEDDAKDEQVRFSDTVLKQNKTGKHQKRDVVITTHRLYNFLPGNYTKCQREIPIHTLRGLVVNPTMGDVLVQVRSLPSLHRMIFASAVHTRLDVVANPLIHLSVIHSCFSLWSYR